MDDDLLHFAINQGLGHVLVHIRCPKCGYIPETNKEKLMMGMADSPCLNCGAINHAASLMPITYLSVTNWVGEYAISDKARDHVSAVVLFCALTEAIFETLKADYLKLHPEITVPTKKHTQLKDVFGRNLGGLLANAPVSIRGFTATWKQLKDKRDAFLHGTSSEYHIHKADAKKAINATMSLFRVYAWLDNKLCLRQ